jgi:hypothetical protein
MLGIDVGTFAKSVEADGIYWQARLNEQANQRKAVMMAARQGDAQAQKLVLEWAKVSDV